MTIMFRIFNLLISLMLVMFLFSCSKKETREVPLGTVAKGTLYLDLHEEGEVEAINSIVISSPNISWRYGNMKVTDIVKDGAEVMVGDTLIMFDPSEVNKAIVDAESRLEISEAELEKLIAQQESEMEELKSDYEVTMIAQEISKIRFESAAYESEVKKKEIKLNLDKADIALEKAKEQIGNRQKIQIEDVKQKKLSITQDRGRLEEAHETLQKLCVVTPSPGIAIINRNWSTGSKYQVGDQCWAGSPLIQLPDLSALKAVVRINEVDISKLTKGLEVEIKPDAFSDSIFKGRVNAVANLAVNKDGSNKIKVFPVEILIDGRNENLLPGLTVSCRIILDKIDDVLYVPIDAVKLEGDKNYVFKKTAGGFEKVEVETGANNSDYIIITKGLDEKDKIALIDPFVTESKKKETTKEN